MNPRKLDKFFGSKSGKDPTYEWLRKGETSKAREERDYVETVWTATRSFLNDDTRKNAPDDFESSWWEMILTARLIKNGVQPRDCQSRTHTRGGPDLEFDSPRCWIEAVTASRGSGVDSVSDPHMVRRFSGDIDTNAIRLRLTTALSAKRAAYEKYREGGIVKSNEPFVIALSTQKIPFAMIQPPMPYAVEVAFGVGGYQTRESIDQRASSEMRSRLEYTPKSQLTKSRGEPVDGAIFRLVEYSGISALIYWHSDSVIGSVNSEGGVDETTRLEPLEWHLIMNPLASNPLDRTAFRFDRTWTFDLRSHKISWNRPQKGR